MTVAPDGRPYVAWGDDSGGDWEIYVRRWQWGFKVYLPLILKSH